MAASLLAGVVAAVLARFYIAAKDSEVLAMKEAIASRYGELSALFAITYFIDRHFKKKEFNVSTYQVSFASFILEVFVMLIFGSVMKTWAFGSTMFIAIFFSQLIVTFFNVPLNTFLLSYIMYLSRNILRHE